MCSLLGQWRNKGVHQGQVIKNHSFFHVCRWKSNGRLPWYSWMQRWIYEIHLLIGKINHRALNILFFLHKCHSILKVEVKCLRKMKKFDMEFFFKLLNEIVVFNNNLFQVSVRDQETKINWSLVILQLIFLWRCVCKVWSLETLCYGILGFCKKKMRTI